MGLILAKESAAPSTVFGLIQLAWRRIENELVQNHAFFRVAVAGDYPPKHLPVVVP